MSRKVQVLLIDDIDGSEATETLVFSLDGTSYEIDVSTEHAAGLRESLAPFVVKARQIRMPHGRGKSPAPRGDRDQSRAVRTWAEAEGIKVNQRGRLPADVVEKYKAAQGNVAQSIKTEAAKLPKAPTVVPVTKEEPATDLGGAIAVAVAESEAATTTKPKTVRKSRARKPAATKEA